MLTEVDLGARVSKFAVGCQARARASDATRGDCPGGPNPASDHVRARLAEGFSEDVRGVDSRTSRTSGATVRPLMICYLSRVSGVTSRGDTSPARTTPGQTFRRAMAPLIAIGVLLLTSSSFAADPTLVDCISANEASITLRHDHRLREARQQLLVCAALACPAEVRAECERRVVDVNAAMPTITFEAKDPAGNDLLAVSVTVDGKPLVDKLQGTAISLDPGAHSFRFEAGGYAPVEKAFLLEEGRKGRREEIVFGKTPTDAGAMPQPTVGRSSRGGAPEVARASRGGGLAGGGRSR